MRHIFNLTKMLLMMVFCSFINACSNDDDFIEQEQIPPTGEVSIHTIPMNFIGDVVTFESEVGQSPTRATTSSSWKNGDKIYITFYNGSFLVPGEATYNSSSGWSVSYDGELTTGTDRKCEVRYFVNATFANSSLVSLNSNSEIYEDVNGAYTFDNGSLTVQATLSPKTGRIRFTGTQGDKIHTTGISVYTTFAPAINTFSSSDAMITSTVSSDGSTPYIYGVFSDSDRRIGLVGSDFAYTRTCTSNILEAGESGYMAIPSESAHNNWRNGLYVKASDVEFKMIPVAGHSGGLFLIGETEVTEALYKCVNGTSSTSKLPISNISPSTMISWIEKINNQTKLNFSLPSQEQWLYAAKGGNKSQGYTYSGSNIPGDVAWYAANCSSKQNVKTKTPNELGIYDMSGNVAEMSSQKHQYYTTEHYYYGGGYTNTSSSCKVTSNNGCSNLGGNDIGFRLVLTCK